MAGKAGENGQNSGERAQPGQDRRLPCVVTHPRPLRVIKSVVRTARGSLSTGSPGGRTPTKEMAHCQAYVTAARTVEKKVRQFERSRS